MQQSNRIFLGATSETPTLYFDLVLVESRYPMLFTCRDDNGQMYIVSCHVANGEKCEWLIAKTTTEMITKLLSDEVPIRSMFTINTTIYIATQCAGETAVSIRTVKVCDIPSNILPTESEYIEADKGEFELGIK